MGTRNLTKVIDRRGNVVVAQYGQWDGYPAGQGVTALYHLHNASGILLNLDKCYFIDEKEAENINSIVGANNQPIFDLYPTLSRDTGADILGYIIYATGKIPLSDQREFENDGLFCEAVYTVDFQQKKFIAKWNNKEFSWDFLSLPTKEQFLEVWELDKAEERVLV